MNFICDLRIVIVVGKIECQAVRFKTLPLMNAD
jgi:hypothetical protein